MSKHQNSKISINVGPNVGPPMSLLFLVFLVLKLTGHIAWSWVWVTAPLWGGLAIFFAFFLFIVLLAALAAALDS